MVRACLHYVTTPCVKVFSFNNGLATDKTKFILFPTTGINSTYSGLCVIVTSLCMQPKVFLNPDGAKHSLQPKP